ncbi:MAG: hypothetical protein AAFV95_14830 [Bacteroidota bacterium]
MKTGIYYFSFILLTFSFSCNHVNEKSIVEIKYFPNGKEKLIVYLDSLKERRCGQFFFKTGVLKKEFCYLNNDEDVLDGEFKEYYRNGNVKSVTQYYRGVKNGLEKYYYENGNVEQQINCVDGKREGELLAYDSTGHLKTINYAVNDFVHYIGQYKLMNDQNVLDKEEFILRIELSKDTIVSSDTLTITFLLPINDKVNLDNFVARYDLMRPYEKTVTEYPMPANSVSMKNGAVTRKYIIEDSGQQMVYGYLSRKEGDGEETIHSSFEKAYFVTE